MSQHPINPGSPHWVLRPQQCRGPFRLHLQAIHLEMLGFLQTCQEHHHLPLLQRSRVMKYKPQISIPTIRRFLEARDPPIPEKTLWKVLPLRWSMTQKIYLHLHHGEKCRLRLHKVSHNTPRLLLHLPQAERFRGNPSKYNDKASVVEGPWIPLDYPASKALSQATLTWVKIVDGGPNQTLFLRSFKIDGI